MIKRALFVIPTLLCFFDPASAEDWPQWRGPDRSGISKETGLLESWPAKGPKLLWTFRDAGPGYSCMSVVGDRLYSMGGEGEKEYVYGVDLKTQKKIWSVEMDAIHRDAYGYGPRSTPTVDGDFLYAVSCRHGNLVCVDVVKGEKVWSQAMKTALKGERGPCGYCESPLVDRGLVIATPGGVHGSLAAFDKKTGALKWRSSGCPYWTAFSSVIAVEVGGVRQYVQVPGAKSDVSNHAVGVRAADGKLLWEFEFSLNIDTPIYRDDCVYFSSMMGCKLVKLVPDGGGCKAQEVYANREMKNGEGGVVLVGEHVYGYADKGGAWVCQDFKTGKQVWSKNSDLGSANVVFADGNLYCCHSDGTVLLIKAAPAGYQEKGRFCIPERSEKQPNYGALTAPIVANGKLYLRDQDLIFCYDIRKPH